MNSARAILHLDLGTFFISCERQLETNLVGKPVLVGGTSDRGVVASCSYEARELGVHSAMPMNLAKHLCPEAIIIRGNSSVYMKKSEEVTQVIRESVPAFEKTSVDEFYLDLSGMDKFFNCMKWAIELRNKIINETNLPISFGLSENKTVPYPSFSKVATGEAKPNNKLKIDYGKEKAFLAPLSVKKIPMIGDKTYQALFQLGVRDIRTLQEMPCEMLDKAFGKNGITMWNKANGIDHSPVIPYQERKSISTERTFERDSTNVNKMKSFITAMAENLAFQLRRGKKLTSCVSVKIRYSDFSTETLQTRLQYTSADHILIPKIKELFDKLYNKRLLVRLVGIKYSHLVGGHYQIQLFDDAEKTIRLYQAMDFIRNKHGDRSIVRVSGMGAKTIGRYNPFTGGPPPLLANRKA